LVVPAGTPPGSVCLTSLIILDELNNENRQGTLNSTPLDSLVTDFCFTIVNSTLDETPPVLVSASLSTDLVDVTSGSQDVVLTAEITDDLSGVKGMGFYFTGAWDVTACCVDSSSDSPQVLRVISGTRTSGTWQATLVVPAGTPSGSVCLTALIILDELNNEIRQGTLTMPVTPLDPLVADFCFTIVNTGG
jgi:hypothetical protein